MEAFMWLGDWLVDAIQASSDPNLKAAQEIMARIDSREIYKPAGTPHLLRNERIGLTLDEVRAGIVGEIGKICRGAAESDRRRAEDDLICDFTDVDWGKKVDGKSVNSVTHSVVFFNPKQPDALPHHIKENRFQDLFLPRAYRMKMLNVWTRSDESLPTIEQAYTAYRESLIDRGDKDKAPSAVAALRSLVAANGGVETAEMATIKAALEQQQSEARLTLPSTCTPAPSCNESPRKRRAESLSPMLARTSRVRRMEVIDE